MAEIISTGIQRLDHVLIEGKGIAAGSTVLIEGTSGAGKELFAKQFAACGVGPESVVYFSTDESSEELVETYEHYNWPTDLRIVNIGTQFFEKVLSRDLQASQYKQEGLAVSELRNVAAYGEGVVQSNFLADMVYEICKLTAPFRVTIDSLDFFLHFYPVNEVLSAMRTIKSYVSSNKGTALFTISKGAHDVKIVSGLSAIADVIIEMEAARIASEFENRLIIKKIRNHPEKAVVLIYAITEQGITPEMITRVV
jgi:KaiC/GvpD/RAD55 family RecA-like ATPase|tara:strand:+ start:3620 stop:4381 length:762 start_codon:yes stop_codon:yes gene_type:complete